MMAERTSSVSMCFRRSSSVISSTPIVAWPPAHAAQRGCPGGGVEGDGHNGESYHERE